MQAGKAAKRRRSLPRVTERKIVFQTEWFSLEEKSVEFADLGKIEKFYSINEGDHVAVIAEDKQGQVLLVKQYRPALEKFLMEIPGGHVEDENPDRSARDELLEETGYEAGRLEFLGKVVLDSGRNQGHLFCYYASELRQVADAEHGVETKLIGMKALREMILEGKFSHSLYLSVVFLAVLRGFLVL